MVSTNFADDKSQHNLTIAEAYFLPILYSLFCSVGELSSSLSCQDFKLGLECSQGHSNTHVEVLIVESGTIFSLDYIHFGESCLAVVCGAKHGQDAQGYFPQPCKSCLRDHLEPESGRVSPYKLLLLCDFL